MSSLKKFIIHTGCPKTGSSALQAYFAANQKLLAASNIDYKNAPSTSRPDEITSGNGLELYYSLAESGELDSLQEIIKNYFDGGQLALCSSEYFSIINGEQWILFRKACAKLLIEPVFVVFVRDVEPFFASAYNQAVKRHGIVLNYDDSK